MNLLFASLIKAGKTKGNSQNFFLYSEVIVNLIISLLFSNIIKNFSYFEGDTDFLGPGNNVQYILESSKTCSSSQPTTKHKIPH